MHPADQMLLLALHRAHQVLVALGECLYAGTAVGSEQWLAATRMVVEFAELARLRSDELAAAGL